MNKIVLVFVLLKLLSNLMLGIFDAAVENTKEFEPMQVIEKTGGNQVDTVHNYAKILSVER